jgi:ferredoxin--NADP+ reductase
LTFVITQPCCNDAACVPVCPVNCIHPTPDEPEFATAEQLYIDPETCIECAACMDACPVSAIHPDYELPDDAERFLDLNASWYEDPAHQGYPTHPWRETATRGRVRSDEPLRVAVVGSGPAAWYFVEECLAALGASVHVSVFERLPVVGGLVRHGIAPDHQSTKAVWERFARTLRAGNVQLYLNCEVGTDIAHDELLRHHHAVVYATGAPVGARLGIPGEDLPGSVTAEAFVSWYNGHPDHAGLEVGLAHERAVVVGTGNVALDVARILTARVDDLRATDIADHALQRLAESNIREVVVLGRRGPAHAAFTAGELLGLAARSAVAVTCPAEAPADADEEPSPTRAFTLRLLAELAEGGGDPAAHDRRIVLRFGAAPVALGGEASVQVATLARQEAVLENGAVRWRPTRETEELPCGLVVSCIGYRGSPSTGLPFDESRGVIASTAGRIGPGRYVVGWAKRGATGGVGLNRRCAQETLTALLADHEADVLNTPADDGSLAEALAGRPIVDRNGWLDIDARERAAGREQARPRIKLVSVDEMLRLTGTR